MKRDKSVQMIKTSRENLFSNLFFPGKYIYYQTNRPYSRGQATLSSVGNHLYLFGGLSFERLNDMWRCDTASKNILNYI